MPEYARDASTILANTLKAGRELCYQSTTVGGGIMTYHHYEIARYGGDDELVLSLDSMEHNDLHRRDLYTVVERLNAICDVFDVVGRFEKCGKSHEVTFDGREFDPEDELFFRRFGESFEWYA